MVMTEKSEDENTQRGAVPDKVADNFTSMLQMMRSFSHMWDKSPSLSYTNHSLSRLQLRLDRDIFSQIENVRQVLGNRKTQMRCEFVQKFDAEKEKQQLVLEQFRKKYEERMVCWLALLEMWNREVQKSTSCSLPKTKEKELWQELMTHLVNAINIEAVAISRDEKESSDFKGYPIPRVVTSSKLKDAIALLKEAVAETSIEFSYWKPDEVLAPLDDDWWSPESIKAMMSERFLASLGGPMNSHGIFPVNLMTMEPEALSKKELEWCIGERLRFRILSNDASLLNVLRCPNASKQVVTFRDGVAARGIVLRVENNKYSIRQLDGNRTDDYSVNEVFIDLNPESDQKNIPPLSLDCCLVSPNISKLADLNLSSMNNALSSFADSHRGQFWVTVKTEHEVENRCVYEVHLNDDLNSLMERRSQTLCRDFRLDIDPSLTVYRSSLGKEAEQENASQADGQIVNALRKDRQPYLKEKINRSLVKEIVHLEGISSMLQTLIKVVEHDDPELARDIEDYMQEREEILEKMRIEEEKRVLELQKAAEALELRNILESMYLEKTLKIIELQEAENIVESQYSPETEDQKVEIPTNVEMLEEAEISLETEKTQDTPVQDVNEKCEDSPALMLSDDVAIPHSEIDSQEDCGERASEELAVISDIENATTHEGSKTSGISDSTETENVQSTTELASEKAESALEDSLMRLEPEIFKKMDLQEEEEFHSATEDVTEECSPEVDISCHDNEAVDRILPAAKETMDLRDVSAKEQPIRRRCSSDTETGGIKDFSDDSDLGDIFRVKKIRWFSGSSENLPTSTSESLSKDGLKSASIDDIPPLLSIVYPENSEDQTNLNQRHVKDVSFRGRRAFRYSDEFDRGRGRFREHDRFSHDRGANRNRGRSLTERGHGQASHAWRMGPSNRDNMLWNRDGSEGSQMRMHTVQPLLPLPNPEILNSVSDQTTQRNMPPRSEREERSSHQDRCVNRSDRPYLLNRGDSPRDQAVGERWQHSHSNRDRHHNQGPSERHFRSDRPHNQGMNDRHFRSERDRQTYGCSGEQSDRNKSYHRGDGTYHSDRRDRPHQGDRSDRSFHSDREVGENISIQDSRGRPRDNDASRFHQMDSGYISHSPGTADKSCYQVSETLPSYQEGANASYDPGFGGRCSQDHNKDRLHKIGVDEKQQHHDASDRHHHGGGSRYQQDTRGFREGRNGGKKLYHQGSGDGPRHQTAEGRTHDSDRDKPGFNKGGRTNKKGRGGMSHNDYERKPANRDQEEQSHARDIESKTVEESHGPMLSTKDRGHFNRMGGEGDGPDPNTGASCNQNQCSGNTAEEVMNKKPKKKRPNKKRQSNDNLESGGRTREQRSQKTNNEEKRFQGPRSFGQNRNERPGFRHDQRGPPPGNRYPRSRQGDDRLGGNQRHDKDSFHRQVTDGPTDTVDRKPSSTSEEPKRLHVSESWQANLVKRIVTNQGQPPPET